MLDEFVYYVLVYSTRQKLVNYLKDIWLSMQKTNNLSPLRFTDTHLPNLLAMTPTLKEPTMPPTLKTATAKLHTMVQVPGSMGAP